MLRFGTRLTVSPLLRRFTYGRLSERCSHTVPSTGEKLSNSVCVVLSHLIVLLVDEPHELPVVLLQLGYQLLGVLLSLFIHLLVALQHLNFAS